MSQIDGRSTFDVMQSGWTRKVVPLNSNGTVAVSIPVEAARDNGILEGDKVVIIEADDSDEHTLELHFENDE